MASPSKTSWRPISTQVIIDRKLLQRGTYIPSLCETDFWQLGHEMFRSTPESFPVPFIQGSILEPSFLSPIPILREPLPVTSLVPDIHSPTLKSLNPLRSHLSAIFCGAFFHLFDETTQYHIARSLASLLSPQPGSMIFGVHGSRKEGEKEKGFWHPTGSERWMFCHSVDSWTALWAEIFGEVGAKVKVEARVTKEIGGDDLFGTYPGNKEPYHVMEWSVTRL